MDLKHRRAALSLSGGNDSLDAFQVVDIEGTNCIALGLGGLQKGYRRSEHNAINPVSQVLILPQLRPMLLCYQRYRERQCRSIPDDGFLGPTPKPARREEFGRAPVLA